MRISDWSSDVCSSDLLRDIIVEAAVEFARGAVIDQHQPVRGHLEHVAIVTHHQHRAGIIVERLHQRLARIDVEVVGRLVEDQQVRRVARRSEEHTSELQSLMRISYAVFCLKKKKTPTTLN